MVHNPNPALYKNRENLDTVSSDLLNLSQSKKDQGETSADAGTSSSSNDQSEEKELQRTSTPKERKVS